MISVVVTGSEGRMGSQACDAIENADDLQLAGRADPALGVSLEDLIDQADVMVDFTVPEAALGNIRTASAAGVHSVVGTTGFDLDALNEITGANILVAPNFALGAVLMMRFAAEAAAVFGSAEIIELHHDRKLDIPSGTAALTAERIEAVSDTNVPIHSVRLPGLVAHQEVIFGSLGETLTIRHDSIDRSCFMPGVLLAVRRVGGLDQSPAIGLETVL